MVDFFDLLQCSVCGTFYRPEITPTGQTIPHCVLPLPVTGLSVGQRIEARVVEGYRLTDVVGLLLTGTLLDMEV